jgi:hypothetical protein
MRINLGAGMGAGAGAGAGGAVGGGAGGAAQWQQRPRLPLAGHDLVAEIARRAAASLRSHGFDGNLGVRGDGRLLHSVVQRILPPIAVVPRAEAGLGDDNSFLVLLVSPASPDADPTRTPTGRQLAALAAAVSTTHHALCAAAPECAPAEKLPSCMR